MPTLKRISACPGARLRRVRKSLGLSSTEAAGRLGVVPSYLSDVERGRRFPTLDWLAGVAKTLGIDPATLDSRLAPRAIHLVRWGENPRRLIGLSDADRAELSGMGIADPAPPSAILRAAAKAGRPLTVCYDLPPLE